MLSILLKWDVILLFYSLSVSSQHESQQSVSVLVCVFVCVKAGGCSQTLPCILHFPAALVLQSEVISELIDVSPSCATRTLLNTDPSHRLQDQILVIRTLIDCNVAFEKN